MPIIYDPNPSYHYPFYCYIHMLPDWTPFYKKMSKSRKGVPKSEETRKKMSEARKRRVSNNKGETR